IALHFGDPPYPVTVRDEVCDGFVIGGGVSQVLQQGTLAQAFDRPFWLQLVGTGLTTALSLQLGAILPMAQWPAVNCMNNYSDDLLAEPLVIAGGYAHVPEAPGLGIQVDEEALSRYRAETACELERPQALLSIVWPGGMVRHYADIHQVWTDGFAGNIPAQARGVTMKVTPDDGTPEWADLFARAQKAPVHDVA
ncbi:MAG: enolase, partial [Anaerolineales bacterium]|nr:enolase [Anaerolineales bacterium]